MNVAHPRPSDEPLEPGPWLESRAQRKAMAYLGCGLALAEGFMVITGEPGVGKSSLVARLLATADRTRLTAISLAAARTEGRDVARLVAQALGITPGIADTAPVLDALEQRLEAEMRAGKRTLLVVDAAHDLSVAALEQLQLLSCFQVGGRALIQILLVGQPELRERLAAPSLEPLCRRIIASYHLEGIAADAIASAAAEAGGASPESVGPEEKILSFRSARSTQVIPESPSRPAPLAEAGLEHRIAALEARCETQEALLRRTLTLLIDWVENRGLDGAHRSGEGRRDQSSS